MGQRSPNAVEYGHVISSLFEVYMHSQVALALGIQLGYMVHLMHVGSINGDTLGVDSLSRVEMTRT